MTPFPTLPGVLSVFTYRLLKIIADHYVQSYLDNFSNQPTSCQTTKKFPLLSGTSAMTCSEGFLNNTKFDECEFPVPQQVKFLINEEREQTTFVCTKLPVTNSVNL
jgi:hypothetical protein